MINKTLFVKTLKTNYKLLVIFALVLAMYFSIIFGMYDPEDLGIMEMLAEMKLPTELINAMGFNLTDPSLAGFLSSYFYGMLMLAFPMIYYVILGNKLVAGLVDKGSMAYLLSSPHTRTKIVVTQGIYLLSGITVLVAFVTGLGIALSQIQFPGALDVKAFVLMNVGVLLLHYAISGICFFASCLFNESKYSLLLGAGLPIAFLLIQMISNAGSQMEGLKYLTVFSLFNAGDIIAGESIILPFMVLGLMAATLYSAGVIIFNKKNLPI